MNKNLLLACCFLLLLSSALLSCGDVDTVVKLNDNAAASVDTSHDLTGTIPGVGKVIYQLSTGTVTCTDEDAQFSMTMVRNGTMPSDTLLTQKAGKGENYFRLDITAVLRILDEGKCIERDPSDDRVAVKIEGFYTPSNYKFTAISCGNVATLGNSEIYLANEDIVSGTVECVNSDQMKTTFQFSNLKLK